jgi:hypothetical protein
MIEFDQWTDLRPLNYKETSIIKKSESKNDQFEGGNLQSSEKPLLSEE